MSLKWRFHFVDQLNNHINLKFVLINIGKTTVHFNKKLMLCYFDFGFFLYCPCILPEGSLMEEPPDLSNLRRLFLNLPFRVLGLGLPIICWRIMMLSSLSTNSISLSFSSCSRLYRNSSTFFCFSASFVSSSSRLLSSYKTITELQIAVYS